ncbi:MAG: HAD family hydrolase [Dehalococcoidia bacterium]|nr:HAD family hydrolase [Dehalococcoidia bacterium]
MKTGHIKIISFDAEGTLVTTRFSQGVWHEGVPALYAKKKGIPFENARAFVTTAYDEVGDQKPEWYDVQYWLERFGVDNYRPLLDKYHHQIDYYPDVKDTLTALGENYTLIVSSATAREFLDVILDETAGYFAATFSAISDYQKCKDSDFYSIVCRKMGVKPSEIIHVGDNLQSDFIAPQEAGIEAFHLDRDGTGAGKDRTIKSLRELVERLKQ